MIWANFNTNGKLHKTLYSALGLTVINLKFGLKTVIIIDLSSLSQDTNTV